MTGDDDRLAIVIKIIERFGLPTLLVAVLLWGFYLMVFWSAENIFAPLTKEHIQTMQTIRESATKQNDLIVQMHGLINDDVTRGDERTKILNDILSEQRRTTSTLEAMLSEQRDDEVKK